MQSGPWIADQVRNDKLATCNDKLATCNDNAGSCHAGLDPASMQSGPWIADQVRNDKLATCNDNAGSCHAGLDPASMQSVSWIADAEAPDPGSSPGQALIRGRNDSYFKPALSEFLSPLAARKAGAVFA
jgi:hypothetical protein